MNLYKSLSTIALSFIFIGCEAGVDQIVLPNTVVTLGAVQYDSIEEYNWEQVSGTQVILSSYHIYNPTFTSPNTDKRVEIIFDLYTKKYDEENEDFFSHWFGEYVDNYTADSVRVIVKNNDKILNTSSTIDEPNQVRNFIVKINSFPYYLS